jgi:NitT/TauT family transport system substrate-binding protein
MKSPQGHQADLPPPGRARPSSLPRQHWPHGFARPQGARIIQALAAVCAVVLLVVIFYPSRSGSVTPARPAPPERPDLTVAVVPAVDSAGFFVALHKGLFTQHGLRVHFVPAVSSETVIDAQELLEPGNQVDISCGNYVSYIEAQQAWDRGTRPSPEHPSVVAADLDIFAEGSVMQPGTQGLYVMPGSPILTLAGLRGRTIGVNVPRGVLYLLAASVLADHGIRPGEVRFAAPQGGFPVLLAQLGAGRIDAAVLPEPFGSIASLSMGAVELADLDQGATTAFPVQGCAATKSWAQEYPRTLAAFRAAYEQGQQIADANRAAVEAAMEALPAPFGLTPVQAAVIALDSYPVGPVDTVRVQRVADVMHEFLNAPAFSVRPMVTSND